MSTLQCFVSSDARDQHFDAVTAVHYSSDGRLYVSSSVDGSIKVSQPLYMHDGQTVYRFDIVDSIAMQVWDGVSNRCINTYKSAHGGEIVSSVRFSKNSKYILSSGRDGVSALWELSTGKSPVYDVIDD